jgi:hypothetical protein
MLRYKVVFTQGGLTHTIYMHELLTARVTVACLRPSVDTVVAYVKNANQHWSIVK